MLCKYCKSDALVEQLTPDGMHHGKICCATCNKFQDWMPKPDRDKAKRPAAHRDLVKKYSRGFCEICLVEEKQLEPNRGLVAHHIVEYQHIDEHQGGGNNTRENIDIVCTACHRLIHWRRDYLWDTAGGEKCKPPF